MSNQVAVEVEGRQVGQEMNTGHVTRMAKTLLSPQHIRKENIHFISVWYLIHTVTTVALLDCDSVIAVWLSVCCPNVARRCGGCGCCSKKGDLLMDNGVLGVPLSVSCKILSSACVTQRCGVHGDEGWGENACVGFSQWTQGMSMW